MKKELKQTLKVIILGLILGFGISLISAQSAGTNTPTPLNVGPSTQVVNSGQLTVGAGKNVITNAGILTNNVLTSGNVGISSLAGSQERRACSDSSGKLFVCPN